jgi:5-methyltetrahydropteroyltriglutamate--homocysteine methyltransferase
MNRVRDRIRTTHTGSLPRPGGLAERLEALEEGLLADDELVMVAERVRAGVDELVARQVSAGLDIVSDGEVSKFSYATYVRQRLTGFEGASMPLHLSEFGDFPGLASEVTASVVNPSCTGPVAFRGADAVATDIANLTAALQAASGSEGFMNAASPGIIASYFHDEYYESDEEYLWALAEAMKPEYDMIAASGLLLQVDCPDLALGRHFAPEPLPVDAFRALASQRVEALNHALRDIPPERMRMHVCWGNYLSPHHHDIALDQIVDIVLRARPAALLIEAANPRHSHEWRVFESVRLPPGKVLVPGVIDPLTPYIEHPCVVADRIRRYVSVVGPERVIAGTDCGFATAADSTTVDPEIAWAKLGSLVEGADLASRELRSHRQRTARPAITLREVRSSERI